jgi:hypothetical protein
MKQSSIQIIPLNKQHVDPGLKSDRHLALMNFSIEAGILLLGFEIRNQGTEYKQYAEYAIHWKYVQYAVYAEYVLYV